MPVPQQLKSRWKPRRRYGIRRYKRHLAHRQVPDTDLGTRRGLTGTKIPQLRFESQRDDRLEGRGDACNEAYATVGRFVSHRRAGDISFLETTDHADVFRGDNKFVRERSAVGTHSKMGVLLFTHRLARPLGVNAGPQSIKRRIPNKHFIIFHSLNLLFRRDNISASGCLRDKPFWAFFLGSCMRKPSSVPFAPGPRGGSQHPHPFRQQGEHRCGTRYAWPPRLSAFRHLPRTRSAG